MSIPSLSITRNLLFEAEQIVPKAQLLGHLNSFPNIKITSLGIPISCSMQVDTFGSILSADFYKNRISISVKSSSVDVISMKKTSILILSLLAYLSGAYSVRMDRKAYEFIVSAIKEPDKKESANTQDGNPIYQYCSELKNTNAALSSILVKQQTANRTLSESVRKYKAIFGKLALTYLKNSESIKSFCDYTGIDNEHINWAVNEAMVNEYEND
ncbi:hypothetical protein M1583_02605 [Candidatus Marsarchaeota archaeon]|nr:hypothetical protein [Candidatus Marsarchaeota archaeon]